MKKPTSTVTKAMGDSAPSVKGIIDANNVTLTTLEDLNKNSIKKKRFPVDSNNPDFHNSE